MERGPQVIKNRISAGNAIGLFVLIVVLVTTLLSDIDSLIKLGLAVILAGAIIGPLMFTRGNRSDLVVSADSLGDARINSASIPVRGGFGAGILILILLTGVLLDLPQLRWIALIGIVAGVAFGGVLVLWRRYQG